MEYTHPALDLNRDQIMEEDTGFYCGDGLVCSEAHIAVIWFLVIESLIQRSAPLPPGRKVTERSHMPSYVQHARLSLTQLAADGADAKQIADRAVAMWCDVDAVLSPIIGQRGVAALFKRSLLLTGAADTPMAAALEGMDTLCDFAGLRATLEQLAIADAIAMNDVLLQKFSELLISLIGESLTERLLHSVPDNPSSDGAVREKTP